MPEGIERGDRGQVPDSGDGGQGQGGGDGGAQGAGADPENHPIFAALKKIKRRRDYTLVHGYRRNIDAKTARIYLDLNFKTYYQLPRKRILYGGDPDPRDSTKPTPILIDARGPVTVVHATDTSYLRGGFTSKLPLHPMHGFLDVNSDAKLNINSCKLTLLEVAKECLNGNVIPTKCTEGPP